MHNKKRKAFAFLNSFDLYALQDRKSGISDFFFVGQKHRDIDIIDAVGVVHQRIESVVFLAAFGGKSIFRILNTVSQVFRFSSFLNGGFDAF